ncbi:hypothetical protein MTO96_032328 [Rhipicephalus appendiculatus]
MAFMSRATAYRRISHALQADVRAILVTAGEGINAQENLSRVAFTSNQPEVPEPPLNCSLSQVDSAGFYGGVQPEVPESPLNRSLGQVASAGIYGGVPESCDVEYHTGDCMHSVPVEPDSVPDGCHRCLTQQDTATDSNSSILKELDIASLREDLRQRGLEPSVPHDAVTNLLKVLHSYSCMCVFFGECKPYQANVYLRPFVCDLCKLMCGVLTNDIRNPNATLKDVEKASVTWFRHAAERLAAKQK